ncbi:hypothetical protein SH1V18_21090 [Vallitalea longa]|uniref:Holin n=1 Tax=Vallitalea longa TaxID=2936439 RepID=A0A9W6DGD9_9FIRM|nr:phage holin family protein [Vallitalea longa]GKX29629.1 hypothetical protein SH1V18_21090 [Vallitalea longa]
MSMEQVLQVIRPELLIVVVVCYCLGLFLKNIPHIKDWVIPFVLLISSIIMCVLYMGLVIENTWSLVIVFIGIMQGILCASVSVFGNEILKQITYKRDIDKKRS